jgi:thiamine transport system ATP-binding protein
MSSLPPNAVFRWCSRTTTSSPISISAPISALASIPLRLDAAAWSRVEAALERVGLGRLRQADAGDAVGRRTQRVALARAFARRRPLLLLDEPFDGLGPGLAADMLSLMLDIRAEVGATVIMVTHDPDEASAAADHVLFVSGGRIVRTRQYAAFSNAATCPILRNIWVKAPKVS